MRVMFHLIDSINELNKIKAKEYKYPNQVYKVPVQSSLLHHQVVAASFKNISLCHQQHYNINAHTGEYVEAMETCDAIEESTKCNRTSFSNVQFCYIDHAFQLCVRHGCKLVVINI